MKMESDVQSRLVQKRKLSWPGLSARRLGYSVASPIVTNQRRKASIPRIWNISCQILPRFQHIYLYIFTYYDQRWTHIVWRPCSYNIASKPTYTVPLVKDALSPRILHQQNRSRSRLPSSREANSLSTQLDRKYFDDRTVWSIFWSCFTTLFACSWVAVHPNIPRATDSDALILGRRVATMGYMLLAPELVIFWAAMQHFSANEIAVKHRHKGVWTIAV